MIQLVRDRTRIPPSLVAQKRLTNEALLLGQLPTVSFIFKSSIWGRAKPQYKRESAGKCAYCESVTETVAHGDVEHFRPKSTYWWLAYCYDNYLFSCQICNQTHKGDEFPAAGTRLKAPQVQGGPPPGGLAPDPADAAAVAKFLKLCKKERALIVDPYVRDPEALFMWEADDTLREVRLKARGASGLAHKLAETTIQQLGLNRQELCGWRFREYQALDVFRRALAALSEPVISDVKAEIKRRMESKAPYAAMTRYFVNEAWSLSLS